ncbi:UDP-glucose 4-epimerase [Williamsoniiplasma luminosum]|uniref:UDP-glucose 4-epimerase n=1 Tax=Williamsoniiplasma luminosum TaxID=214888 RepID=A0A2K8NT01_9MOLU|nr:NAD-dependent epimerase/dehydratase family protein [Williamsoniiplasma luminosum]ATZ16894.1 UDP-glucose 4-epimerase [Williamsoniiplasma luminosum]
MKKVLITGSLGQIGSELVDRLRRELGKDNVIATDIRKIDGNAVCENGVFETLDVMDYEKFLKMATDHKVDTIVHLAALLSATAEKNIKLAWHLNMGGLLNALDVAKELKTKIFAPSSIAAYGPDVNQDNTPQDTFMHPTTMYGVTKTAGEMLANYYNTKFGVDSRSVRFPGLISYKTEPGGGTSDYNVDIFYQALLKGTYECYLAEGTKMDMMYMDDAIDAIVNLLNADPTKLIHRNAFNITAMSLAPEELTALIQKHIPSFKITYKVDPVRQGIADSWPNSIDDSAARTEWGFKPKFDAEKMTVEMINKLTEKFKKEGKLK